MTMTLSDGKYTFTVTEACTFAAEFVKKISGGAYRPNTGTEVTWYPSTNGVEKSWAEIAEDLCKMSGEDTIHISLNGQTIVPADVIKAIRDNKLIIEFIVDGKKSRTVNGADIINTAETDFSMIAGSADKSTLRGTVGADIITGAICFPTDLIVKLGTENAGKYANLYKYADGKLTSIGCAKADSSGTSQPEAFLL